MRPVQDAFLDLLKSTLDSEISFIKIIWVICAKNTAAEGIWIIENSGMHTTSHLIWSIAIHTAKIRLKAFNVRREIC